MSNVIYLGARAGAGNGEMLDHPQADLAGRHPFGHQLAQIVPREGSHRMNSSLSVSEYAPTSGSAAGSIPAR